MKEIKVLVIDRDKWLRGANELDGQLLHRRTGLMCCLGFAALACGATQGEINGKQMPWNISDRVLNRIKPKMSWLFPSDKTGKRRLSTISGINDKKAHISETKREEKIKEKFAKHGVKVVFKGRTSKATLIALHGEKE